MLQTALKVWVIYRDMKETRKDKKPGLRGMLAFDRYLERSDARFAELCISFDSVDDATDSRLAPCIPPDVCVSPSAARMQLMSAEQLDRYIGKLLR